MSFTGAQEEDQKLTHQMAEYGDESVAEYDVDKDRDVKQSTGFLDVDENAWIKDFFVSRKKYAIRIDGSLKQIAVISSKVVGTTQDDVFDYEFVFRYGEDSKLLNIDRILNLQAPEGLADFFLAELLAGLPSALYQNNLLLAVQSPFALGWRKLSMAELWSGALPELVDDRTITVKDGKLMALGIGGIDDFTWQAIKDFIALNTDTTIPDTRTVLISGAVIWETGLTYQSTKLVYKILGEDYQISPQSVTLEPPDPNLSRIDVFYVDASSEIGVLKGIPGAIPMKPAVENNQIEVAYAIIAAGATEPSLTVDAVYDETGEWPASETHDTDISIDFADTTEPVSGTKNIELQISIPDTTVATPTHFVGEKYQGGIIYYLNRGAKSGYIVAESPSSPGVRYGESHSSGPTDTSVGAGAANTIILMANAANATCAAFYAANFEKDGFSDWFLGSKMDMEQLVFRKSLFPNFKGAFWTSNQVTGSDDWKKAYCVSFDNGATYVRDKTNNFSIVPVRYFNDELLSAGTPVDIYTPLNTSISFDAPAAIEMTNGILSFYMKSSVEWLSNTAMTLKLYNQGAVVGHLVMSKSAGMAGFNSADPAWQLVAVPVILLALVSNTVDKVRFALANSWPNGIMISFDRIRIQHDTSQVPVELLTPGDYGSASKHVKMTVNEQGLLKNIEEVDPEKVVINSSDQLIVDEDLDFINHKGIRMADGVDPTDAINKGQLDTAVSNAMSGVGSSIHVPVINLAAAKAVSASSRADAMLMLIETMGLYRFDDESLDVSNNTTVILPVDILTDASPGRWIKISSSLSDHNLLSNILGNGGYHLSLAERDKLLGLNGSSFLTSADGSVAINGWDLSVINLKNITRSISFNDTIATIFRDYYKNDFRIAAIDLRGIGNLEYSLTGVNFSPVVLPLTITGNSDIYWKITFTSGASTGFLNITGSDITVNLTTAVMRCISFNDVASPICRDYYKRACTLSLMDKRSITTAEYSLDCITFLPAILPLSIAANSDIYWRVTFAGGATSGFLNITGILN